MIEKFKIIPKFNNKFAATCDGEIYDVKNKCFLEKKLHQGRYYVNLPGFGQPRVHTLVALAYYGEPPFEKADVHHDNEDKLDNSPQNLVYLTRSVHVALHTRYDEKRIQAAKENVKKATEAAAKLPRTEKQLQAVRETIKKAQEASTKLPRTEKQLENLKKAVEAAAKLPRTEKQLKAKSKPVVQYTLDGKFVANYYSACEAARQTGFSQPCISRCARGERNSYKGFKWEYQDNSL